MEEFCSSSGDDVRDFIKRDNTVTVYDPVSEKFYGMTKFKYAQYAATIKDRYKIIVIWDCLILVMTYDMNVLPEVEEYLADIPDINFRGNKCIIKIPASKKLLNLEHILFEHFRLPEIVITRLKEFYGASF